MIDRFGDSSHLTGEIVRGKIISQDFVARETKLGGIGVEFATYCRVNSATIVLEVCWQGKAIASGKVATGELLDNSVHVFKVEADLKVGRPYEIKIYSPDGRPGISVTAKRGDALHDNQWMKMNGAVQRGELCCVIYYGEIPAIYTRPKEIRETPLLKKFKEEKYTGVPETSIIIPTATRIDHLKNCLDSLRVHTCSYEVIVVVNSPNPGYGVAVMKLLRHYPNHVLISIPQFGGYVRTCNMGASVSRGRFICVLNDDIIVRRDWNVEMAEALSRNPKVGQVGPSLLHLNDEFGSSHKPTSHPYLEGWCFMVPRHVYEEIGLFDPDIDFAYCEDSDFSTNVIYHGYEIQKVRANVWHVGHQTSRRSGEEIHSMTAHCEERNKKFLVGKWRALWGQRRGK